MRGAVQMQITTIGLDIAKNMFRVDGIDASEKVVVRKQLRRSQVIAFFSALPACLIGMEACATAHCSGLQRSQFRTNLDEMLLQRRGASQGLQG